MTFLTGLTRAGEPWTPRFITTLNHRACIGCGRCFKVCPRDVFKLVERGEIEENGSEEDEDWEEDGFGDDVAYVMTLANPGDCIGCESCNRVCPKNCQTHQPLQQAA
ncbi:MAG: ferredoxin III, nif-specific [Magnetococcales bacterium]|nr:ferredoxin III, nif-specific [Magnetococcales bacterium]MBF0151624.1 ferredoxin III, nif-specific [Magnetococcales bacterium]MBF0173164.1 ferredoxin III, nif-specific [Magnetococcales bacterium]MBF0348627.1 ferredoxin III, nif-specific [Magnetococcales bacterium]MBF0632885.1 ferredoxin III, nif-specific [Magnetococcales bacterium]